MVQTPRAGIAILTLFVSGSLLGGCSLYQSEASRCLENSGVEVADLLSRGESPAAYCGLSKAASVPAASAFQTCWSVKGSAIRPVGYSEYSTVLQEDGYVFQALLTTAVGQESRCLTAPLPEPPATEFIALNYQKFLEHHKDSTP
jgi:hypothetical protein